MYYKVKPVEQFDSDTKVYEVKFGTNIWDSCNVWYYPQQKKARCTLCQGVVNAMSASCPHARAVIRFIKKENNNG